MDWVKIATQFGIPVVILIAVGWFFGTQVWPLFTAQLKSAAEAREKATADFLTQLDKRDIVNQKQTEAIERLTEEVRRRR